MFRVEAGGSRRYCDGLSRRSFVQVGVAGMASVSLANVLRATESSTGGPKKNTSIILIWLDGGPGHMDMYDMKPEAPAEYRGFWRPFVPTCLASRLLTCFPNKLRWLTSSRLFVRCITVQAITLRLVTSC